MTFASWWQSKHFSSILNILQVIWKKSNLFYFLITPGHGRTIFVLTCAEFSFQANKKPKPQPQQAQKAQSQTLPLLTSPIWTVGWFARCFCHGHCLFTQKPNKIKNTKFVKTFQKIPHTGETESLGVCGSSTNTFIMHTFQLSKARMDGVHSIFVLPHDLHIKGEPLLKKTAVTVAYSIWNGNICTEHTRSRNIKATVKWNSCYYRLQ